MEGDGDDDFSQRWERHISALRAEFSTDSMRALTSGSRSLDGDPGPTDSATYLQEWDDKFNSVVDSLDELAL